MPNRVAKRILVVDDEESVRRVLQSFLEQVGYSVTVCKSGEEALRKVTETPAHFDLVLTDQTMPGMSGTQLASAVQQLNPRRPVILMSGYGGTMDVGGPLPTGVSMYLPKPLQLRDLLTAIATFAQT